MNNDLSKFEEFYFEGSNNHRYGRMGDSNGCFDLSCLSRRAVLLSECILIDLIQSNHYS